MRIADLFVAESYLRLMNAPVPSGLLTMVTTAPGQGTAISTLLRADLCMPVEVENISDTVCEVVL